MKDIRVLCGRCAADYKRCGYKIKIIDRIKEPCDKCGRFGFTVKLKCGGDVGK